MGELNKAFQQYTGLNMYDIETMIDEVQNGTDEEQQKMYDFISWNLKRGVMINMPKFKEKFDLIMNSISALNKKSTIEDVTEGETYTAEEAAAYNLTLDGALQYGAIKTPAVEAVEAQEAVLYENAEEYNAAKGTELTDEQFEALDEEEKIKTPAVEAVEAQDAVEYTNEEVDAYNATLSGAKKAGDPKPAQTNG